MKAAAKTSAITIVAEVNSLYQPGPSVHREIRIDRDQRLGRPVDRVDHRVVEDEHGRDRLDQEHRHEPDRAEQEQPGALVVGGEQGPGEGLRAAGLDARERHLAHLPAVLDQSDRPPIPLTDSREALVDAGTGKRRRDDVGQRRHAGVAEPVPHLIGHRRIEDREQQRNLVGDRAHRQGVPQDDRIGTPHHRDRLHPVLLERGANLLLVRLAQMRDLGRQRPPAPGRFPHSGRRHR